MQVGLDLVGGNAASNHQREDENSTCAVPHRAVRVVDVTLAATPCTGQCSVGVGGNRSVRGQQHPWPKVGQPVQRLQGRAGRVRAVEGTVDPADVVVGQRVSDHQ